ncbi:hypothetical protein [Paraflavitalea speifideaquila]|uniref:hypothetical protein n=1 Tax=Paraflavitalea speifideaquila TaxID=3076558 RepID=UPI0028EBCC0F|nr:hypothetical protein [Paraflavitalea speifideiaquila]
MKRIFPFVTSTVDVFRLTDPNHPTSLKLFASYAQTNSFGDVSTPLNNNTYIPDVNPFYTVGGGIYFPPTTTDPNHAYWTLQAGTRLGLSNNRLSINYQYERRHFRAMVMTYLPPSTYRYIFSNVNGTTHHLGINATLPNKNSLFWLTGINATSIKSKTVDPINYYVDHNVTGDLNSDKTSWTDGWVNRISWKQISAGIDIVYYFNPDLLPMIPGESKEEAISIQNVYVGYKLPLKKTQGLELYAACSNPGQDKDYSITGNRNYYGLGIKAIL